MFTRLRPHNLLTHCSPSLSPQRPSEFREGDIVQANISFEVTSRYGSAEIGTRLHELILMNDTISKVSDISVCGRLRLNSMQANARRSSSAPSHSGFTLKSRDSLADRNKAAKET